MPTPTPLLDAFTTHLARLGKSAQTIKAYRHDLTAFITWFEPTTGRAFDPGAVDPRDLTDYRSALLRGGRKPATINRRLIALSRFFHWATQQGYTRDNPFAILEKVLVGQQRDTAPRWLSSLAELFPMQRLADGLQYAFDPRTTGAGFNGGDLIALLAWTVVGSRLAVRLFRWDSAKS